MFAVKPAVADGAFAADNQDRHWLSKAIVWVGGFSNAACERACGGVLFLAFGDWAEILSARRVLGFKVFGVMEFSVFPLDLHAKGLVSEQGKVELSGDVAEVAVTSKPFAFYSSCYR